MQMLKKHLAPSRLRMLFAGIVSVSVAYAVFLLLIYSETHYQIASVVSFFTYWTINFTLNKYWAFATSGNTHKEAATHFSLHAVNQGVIMLGLYVLIEHFSISPAVAHVIMQIVTTVTVFFLTPLVFERK